MEYPNFIGGSYQSQSPIADQERTVNWYPERMESPGATAPWVLYPTPGVEELAEHPLGPGRGHLYENGREFAVIGTDFVEIGDDGTITDHGNVALDSNPATISSNGDGGGELLITSGGNAYLFTLATDTLSTIAALSGIATMGGHLEGYFLALDAATSKVYASELLDGTTWNTGTSFAQRSLASDPWKALNVVNRNVWFLGEHTSEAWYNSASTPFPFSPHPSGLIQHGIAAAFSGTVLDGALCFLAGSRSGQGYVIRVSGFTPEVVSTYPLQNAINGYNTISDAIGDGYNDLGHSFYLLNFPSQGVTHAWDAQTLLWAERGTWISEDNEYVAWRPRYHVLAFGEHRWLDAQTGSIYRASSSLTTDVDSRAIRRMRRAPALVHENERIFYPGFELLLEAGLGTSGQAEDPQVMLRLSNDGGKTWGAEMMRSAGKTGEFFKRVRWDRLGAARQRVFEVSVSDPIPWRIIGAYLTPDPIRSGGRRAA